MAYPRPNPLVPPPNFLLDFKSITEFTEIMVKLRNGASADAETTLSRDECQRLIWALQVMRPTRKKAPDG